MVSCIAISYYIRTSLLISHQDDTGSASDPEKGGDSSSHGHPDLPQGESALHTDLESPRPEIEGSWILPKNLWILLRHRVYPFLKVMLTHGSSVDIHAMQAQAHTKEARRMQEVFNHAKQYPNSTEHLYSFLQVMTACTASFAHGGMLFMFFLVLCSC